MRSAAAALSLLALAGCAEDPGARARRAQARVIQRQIESLREIRDAVRGRRLVDPRWLAVAVDESAVRTLLEAGLPQEVDVADRFHVRVDAADITFRSGAGLVRLRAVVHDRQRDVRANVEYVGGLDDIVVGPDGRLRTRVLIDNVEVPAAQSAGDDAPAIAKIVDTLAGANLQELQARIPPIEIPVRLQQTLAFDGFADGPVRVRGGELPIQATVARVLPLSGRLWIFLDVKTGPWKPRGEPS